MKWWAFYKDETGIFHNITAYEVLKREKSEPGKWKHRQYYSTHPPADKLLMHHRWMRKTGTCSFIYAKNQEALLEKLGGGESLSHYLFKKAVSELKSTTIIFSNLKIKSQVEFSNMEIEKRIYCSDSYYDIDVYCTFKSVGLLAKKWGGVMGIEIHHTNSVRGKKLADIVDSDIPIIEVDVDKYIYPIHSKSSTHAKERAHINYLKSELTKQIKAKALTNPSTKEYLIDENAYLRKKVSELSQQLESEQFKNSELANEKETLSAIITNKSEHITIVKTEKINAEESLNKFLDMGIMQFSIRKTGNRIKQLYHKLF